MIDDYNKFRTNFIPLLGRLNKIIAEIDTKNKILFRKEPIDQIKHETTWYFRRRKESIVNSETMAFYMRLSSKNSKEYKNFRDILHDIPVINKHIIKAGKIRCNYETINDELLIQDILRIYLKKNESYSTNTRLIRSIFKKIIKHFSKKYFETEYKVYLENIEFESKTIKISNDIKIVSMNKEFIENHYNNDEIFRKFYSGDWLLNMSKVQSMAINIKKEMKSEGSIVKQIKPEFQIVEDEFDKLLDSLRCVSVHQINRSPLVMEVKYYPFFNRKIPLANNMWHNYQEINFHSKYNNRKIIELNKFIAFACAEYDELLNIFRRLSLKDIKYNFEDKVIDLFICFEFLIRIFLPKNHQLRSKKETIALFIPAFIYTNRKERESSYHVIREGYNIRSRIVHADKTRTDEYQTILKVEEIFKKTLSKVIKYYNKIPRKNPQEWLMDLKMLNKIGK